MPVSEELKIVIRADADNAIRNLRNTQGATKSATGSFLSMTKSLIGPLGVAVAVGTVAKVLGKFAISSIKFNAEMEQTTVAFETMLGSAERAKDVLEELTEFSAATPFQLQDLTKGAQQLLAFGTEAGDVRDVLQDLGNAAQGQSGKLDRLVLAYGKLQAKGRASLEELNMFTEAGVPIMDALRKRLDLTKEELFKYVTAGKIGFQDVNAALQDLTRGEGQFAGMLEKQSKTMSGSISTLKDNVKLLGGELFSVFTPAITTAVQGMTSLVGKFRELINQKSEVEEVLAVYNEKLITISETIKTMVLAGAGQEGMTARQGALMDAFKLDPKDTSAEFLDKLFERSKKWIQILPDAVKELQALQSELAKVNRFEIQHGKRTDFVRVVLERQIRELENQIEGLEILAEDSFPALIDVGETATGILNDFTIAIARAGTTTTKGLIPTKDYTEYLKSFGIAAQTTIEWTLELREAIAGLNEETSNSGEILEQLGQDIAVGAGRSGLDALRDLGRLIGGEDLSGEDIIEDFAKSVIDNLPELLLGAGIGAIKNGHIGIGLALIIASGLVALGTGIFEAVGGGGRKELKGDGYTSTGPPEGGGNVVGGVTINMYGDVNDADRFAEKVGEVITRRYATA